SWQQSLLPTGLLGFQDPIDHSMDAPIVSGHVLDALRDHVLSLPAVDGVLSNALISLDPTRIAPLRPRRSVFTDRFAAHPRNTGQRARNRQARTTTQERK
ncbi:MAG TPA: hypothetical protein VGK18_11410, partial [Propionicimonas sp.]|uniref:hypothetical protein n=1 Tax=Propionicimonas sp. TaxID=1955623 RepID=UPI002F417FE7